MNVLVGAFLEFWLSWRNFALILTFALLFILLVISIVFAVRGNAGQRARGKRVSKRTAQVQEYFQSQYDALESEGEKARQALAQSRTGSQKKRASGRALPARRIVCPKGEDLKKRLKQNDMTKREVADYQRREGTYIPEDVVINILTERVIHESDYAMDAAYTDCSIPQSVTVDFNVGDIETYVLQKNDVEIFKGNGKRPIRFKVEGKLFAQIKVLDCDKIAMAFKCGSDYGAQLVKHLSGIIDHAKFPYGLVWFSATNAAYASSFECMKLMVDISYKITKLGY